jgi:hypothetical protein
MALAVDPQGIDIHPQLAGLYTHLLKGGGKLAEKVGPNGEGEMVRLNADVDVETYKRLKHALVEDRLAFATWLRQQIDAYVAGKEPKGKRGKGKGA